MSRPKLYLPFSCVVSDGPLSFPNCTSVSGYPGPPPGSRSGVSISFIANFLGVRCQRVKTQTLQQQNSAWLSRERRVNFFQAFTSHPPVTIIMPLRQRTRFDSSRTRSAHVKSPTSSSSNQKDSAAQAASKAKKTKGATAVPAKKKAKADVAPPATKKAKGASVSLASKKAPATALKKSSSKPNTGVTAFGKAAAKASAKASALKKADEMQLEFARLQSIIDADSSSDESEKNGDGDSDDDDDDNDESGGDESDDDRNPDIIAAKLASVEEELATTKRLLKVKEAASRSRKFRQTETVHDSSEDEEETDHFNLNSSPVQRAYRNERPPSSHRGEIRFEKNPSVSFGEVPADGLSDAELGQLMRHREQLKQARIKQDGQRLRHAESSLAHIVTPSKGTQSNREYVYESSDDEQDEELVNHTYGPQLECRGSTRGPR